MVVDGDEDAAAPEPEDAFEATPGSDSPVEDTIDDAGPSTLAEERKALDVDPKIEPGELLVNVDVDDEGNGQAMVGLDEDSIESVRIINGNGTLDCGPSHTVSISRVTVRGSDVRDGKVVVAVTPKRN